MILKNNLGFLDDIYNYGNRYINRKGMTAKNDITGDKLQSKTTNKKFRDNWDNIFFSMKNKEELIENRKNKKNEKCD
jgi:hypothetical protein